MKKTPLILTLLLATISSPATPPSYDFTLGGSAVPGLNKPQAVAVDSSGDVYVADAGNQRMVKFSRTGSFLLEWGGSGDTPGRFSNPCSIAIDSAGNVYVADAGNEWIQKFTSSGAYVTRWYCPRPTAIAIDRNDYVYVADRGAESLVFNHWGGGWVVEYVPGVRKFTGDGRLLRQWPINTTPFIEYIGFGYSGTYYTGGLALAPNGDIFVAYFYRYTSPFEGGVADWAGAGIEWFTSDATYVLDLGSTASPDALTMDSANNLYATDRSNHRIDMFTFNADGTITGWGFPGSGGRSLSDPRGVAVDPSGNYVYVADAGDHRIPVFAHQPTLNIRSTATNSLILSWSASATGYSLQQKPALVASNWAKVTAPVRTMDGVNQVVVAPVTGNNFYRLARP